LTICRTKEEKETAKKTRARPGKRKVYAKREQVRGEAFITIKKKNQVCESHVGERKICERTSSTRKE